jgi:crossover junction endodeoxyribonuclease RuvC
MVVTGIKDGPLFYDTPKIRIKNRNRVDPLGMSDLLRPWSNVSPKPHVFLENVHAMPHDGSVGAFTFGRGLGIWEGIIVAMQFPYTLVSPNSWTAKMMRDMPDRKKGSRKQRFRQLYPAIETPNEGRIDAMLIAQYGIDFVLND